MLRRTAATTIASRILEERKIELALPQAYHCVNVSRDLVRGLTPFVNVSRIDRSIVYYETLGLRVESRFPERGRTTWAYLRNGGARVMFQQVDEQVDGAAQSVLFYLYVDDLAALRLRLIGEGVEAGEIEDGRPGPTREMRLRDPDGYCLMVAEIEVEEFEPSLSMDRSPRSRGSVEARGSQRSVLARIHNPRGRRCGCAPLCWCQRTPLGRALRWYLPIGHHAVSAEWKRDRDPDKT